MGRESGKKGLSAASPPDVSLMFLVPEFYTWRAKGPGTGNQERIHH